MSPSALTTLKKRSKDLRCDFAAAHDQAPPFVRFRSVG